MAVVASKARASPRIKPMRVREENFTNPVLTTKETMMMVQGAEAALGETAIIEIMNTDKIMGPIRERISEEMSKGDFRRSKWNLILGLSKRKQRSLSQTLNLLSRVSLRAELLSK